MKKEFVQHFKNKGFRINTKKGEAFRNIGNLQYFLRLFEDSDFEGREELYFKFGVLVNSPFGQTLWPFENTVYLNEFCYGGEHTDTWRKEEFDELIVIAESIGLEWLNKYMELSVLSEHIKWRIENGLRWIEPTQLKSDNSINPARDQLVEMLGGAGDKICHNWVKRMYEPLAVVEAEKGDVTTAMTYLNQYLEHISGESFRSEEIERINEKISSGFWQNKS